MSRYIVTLQSDSGQSAHVDVWARKDEEACRKACRSLGPGWYPVRAELFADAHYAIVTG